MYILLLEMAACFRMQHLQFVFLVLVCSTLVPESSAEDDPGPDLDGNEVQHPPTATPSPAGATVFSK